MILSDEELDVWSDRIDAARQRFWDGWFIQHFGKNEMTDMIEANKATDLEAAQKNAEIKILPVEKKDEVPFDV